MGKYENGAYGSFHGKVGNLVGSSWRGISYMRAKPNTGKRKSSEKQIQHRAKFLFATNFIQPLFPVIQIGFRNQNDKKTAKNAAMSEIMNYAITGEYPEFSINFKNLKLSKGCIYVPKSPAVQLVDNRVQFTWTLDIGNEDSIENNTLMQERMEDKIMLVTLAFGYPPVYTLHKYRRENQAGDVGLPDAPPGTEVHCYIAAASVAKHMNVSNSVYAGSVIIPE